MPILDDPPWNSFTEHLTYVFLHDSKETPHLHIFLFIFSPSLGNANSIGVRIDNFVHKGIQLIKECLVTEWSKWLFFIAESETNQIFSFFQTEGHYPLVSWNQFRQYNYNYMCTGWYKIFSQHFLVRNILKPPPHQVTYYPQFYRWNRVSRNKRDLPKT